MAIFVENLQLRNCRVLVFQCMFAASFLSSLAHEKITCVKLTANTNPQDVSRFRIEFLR